MPHIQVADVAQCVATTVELGGKELLHGKDDQGQSLWAGLLDPWGIGFGIIPIVAETMEVGEIARSGHITGLSYLTSHGPSIAEFYGQVVGWTTESSEEEHDCVVYGPVLVGRGVDGLAGELTNPFRLIAPSPQFFEGRCADAIVFRMFPFDPI